MHSSIFVSAVLVSVCPSSRREAYLRKGYMGELDSTPTLSLLWRLLHAAYSTCRIRLD